MHTMEFWVKGKFHACRKREINGIEHQVQQAARLPHHSRRTTFIRKLFTGVHPRLLMDLSEQVNHGEIDDIYIGKELYKEATECSK